VNGRVSAWVVLVSSGMVGLGTWREQLIPMLTQRASMLMDDGGPTGEAVR
jgi:hypothetical protein